MASRQHSTTVAAVLVLWRSVWAFVVAVALAGTGVVLFSDVPAEAHSPGEYRHAHCRYGDDPHARPCPSKPPSNPGGGDPPTVPPKPSSRCKWIYHCITITVGEGEEIQICTVNKYCQ